jgi:cytochrome c oxidase subunit 2
MEPADFDRWLSGNVAESPVAAGKALYTNTLGCASCHGDNGQGGRGPALTGLLGKPVQLDNGSTGTADEAYIRESILNPQAKIVAGYGPIMPTFAGQLSEEQLLQLVSFVKSLSPQQTNVISTTAPARANNPQTGVASPAGQGAKSTESQRSNPVSATAPGNQGSNKNSTGGQRP